MAEDDYETDYETDDEADYTLEVYRAIARALAGTADGDERVAAMEGVVRLADESNDLDLQYYAREHLVDAGCWGGAPEKMLVAFSWMLAQFDRHPGRFDEHALLWKYKWIVSNIAHFPQISKAQIYEMLSDMAARYERAGRGLRVVHQHRYRIEKFFGERERALDYYARAAALPSDDLSNCPACEVDERVSYLLYTGERERALSAAAPVLEGGLACRTVPHRTVAALLVPLLELGRRAEAQELQRRGYRMIEGQQGLVSYASDHLLFLSLVGRREAAAEVFEKNLLWAQSGKDFHRRYEFYRAAWVFFLTEKDAGGDAPARLSLPPTFALYEPSGLYDAARLAGWFEAEARRVARRFDERNGTDHFARELDETPGLLRLREPQPPRAPAPF